MISTGVTTKSILGAEIRCTVTIGGVSAGTWQRQAWQDAAGGVETQSESKLSTVASTKKKSARKSATLRIGLL